MALRPALFVLWAAVSIPLAAAEILVFAAASLTDVLQEIAPDYEKKSGDKLRFSFSASSILARQIQEGAPADVFLSADEEKMDGLEKKGLLKNGTRRNLLSNSLVIVTASDSAVSVTSPEDLRKVRRIAIAEPATVPAGIYARKFLEQAGLWPSLRDAIIPTENVRGALAAVESGNVGAGIVYKTDAAASAKVKIAFEIPVKDSPKILYPMAVIQKSKERAAAGRFLDHLASAAGPLFEKHGFIVLNAL